MGASSVWNCCGISITGSIRVPRKRWPNGNSRRRSVTALPSTWMPFSRSRFISLRRSPNSRMRLHLIIDADDTLWENNIYFERAFDEFVEFLDHSSLTAREIRDVLDEIEAANAKIHGYGSLNFGRNLKQCYQHLVEREVRERDLHTVMGFSERILECPMEVIDGVPETLEYLALRHDLTLFTKGNPEEQKLKIERSGLGSFFGHAAVVKEKD